MIELDPLERTLLLARGELSPTARDKTRHRAALGLRQVTPGTLRTGAPATKPSFLGALRASGNAGLTVGAALLGAGIALGFWLRGATDSRALGSEQSDRTDVSAVVASASNAVSLDAASQLESRASDLIRPNGTPTAAFGAVTLVERTSDRPSGEAARGQSRAKASVAAARDTPTVTVTPKDEELALLQRVERALRANNPAFALALIDELDERFADTRLGEERLAARVIAHCRLGSPGFRLRGQSFLHDSPASVYSDRVRNACALGSGAPPALTNPKGADTHDR